LLDLSPREKTLLYPLVVLTIFFGVYPAPVLDVIGPSVEALLIDYQAALDAAATTGDLAATMN